MVKIEDYCVGCSSMGLPCLGQSCPNRHVEVHYCDKCGEELDERNYSYDGEPEYCDWCREDDEE